MPGRYLVDTNVAIAILNQKIDFQARLRGGSEVFLCPAVVAELLFGAAKSTQVEANTARVEQLVKVCPVLACTLDTARHCAEIRYALRLKGRPIPESDLWIAAAARQHQMILATRDGHFDDVADVEKAAW